MKSISNFLTLQKISKKYFWKFFKHFSLKDISIYFWRFKNLQKISLNIFWTFSVKDISKIFLTLQKFSWKYFWNFFQNFSVKDISNFLTLQKFSKKIFLKIFLTFFSERQFKFVWHFKNLKKKYFWKIFKHCSVKDI